MEKGLYGKQNWWNEKQLIMHTISKSNQNGMKFPEGDFMRIVGEIKGNLAACVGNLVITIKGKLYGIEVIIDTLTVVAAGVSTVLGQKLIDIRGFDEITGLATYTDAGAPARGVTTQVYVGVPYKSI